MTKPTKEQKHEALLFRKVVLLALERCGKDTNRTKRASNRYENMAQFSADSGINRTAVPSIRDGTTKTPTRDTFQKMSRWLLTLQKQGRPLKDENGIVIAYDWVELELLDERAKELGLDETDTYIVKYDEEENPKTKKKSKKKVTSEPKQESALVINDDFLEDPDTVAAAIDVLQHHLKKIYNEKR